MEVALNIVVYLILATIAFGLGVTLTNDQITAIKNYKIAFLIGVASQFGLMPFIGWGLSRLFKMNTGISLGTIILCSAPGGAFSNFFCYHSGGNLALSIAMTVFSTLTAIGMMPLMIWVWADKVGGFEDETKVGKMDVDYKGLIFTLLLVLIPTLLGIYTRKTDCGQKPRKLCCLPTQKKKLYEWFILASTVFGVFFIVLAFAIGIYRYHDQIWQDWKVVLMVLLILPCGATFGYVVAKLVGLEHQEAITVSFETGVQNRIIPLALIELAFDDGGDPDKGDVLQTVLHYICIFYPEILCMWLILRMMTKRLKLKEEIKETVETEGATKI